MSALRSIAAMFSSISEVLDMVSKDAAVSEKRVEADSLLEKTSTFDFAFALFLMTDVMSVTNTLSVALQRKDQDLVNACAMIKSVKLEIQTLRAEGFPCILQKSITFANLHGIRVPQLDDQWRPSGRRVRGRPPHSRELSYQEYFRLEIFIPVLDKLLTELDCRFSEPVANLMGLAASLQPNDNFRRFDSDQLMRLAEMYSEDFSAIERLGLESELRSFRSVVACHPDFASGFKSISDMLSIIIRSGLHESFPLYTRLIRLVLTLPVSTATTERSFSALKIVKTRLRTSMGDSWLVDLLTLYIEKEMGRDLSIDSVVSGFNGMKSRRV
ncbi:MAG: hAT transposon family protein [Nitrososphaerales archaeon]